MNAQAPRCKVGALTLGQEDTRTLADALADTRGVPATTLATALGNVGAPVSATAIKDHRRGVCRCPVERTT